MLSYSLPKTMALNNRRLPSPRRFCSSSSILRVSRMKVVTTPAQACLMRASDSSSNFRGSAPYFFWNSSTNGGS